MVRLAVCLNRASYILTWDFVGFWRGLGQVRRRGCYSQALYTGFMVHAVRPTSLTPNPKSHFEVRALTSRRVKDVATVQLNVTSPLTLNTRLLLW